MPNDANATHAEAETAEVRPDTSKTRGPELPSGRRPFGRYSIGRRIALYSLLFSSVVTLVSTVFLLGLEYRRDVTDIRDRLHQIEAGYSASLASSLWDFNEKDLNLHVNGILRMPDLQYVEILSDQNALAARAGTPKKERVLELSFPLKYRLNDGNDRVIGKVNMTATLDGVYRRLQDKLLVTLVSQTIMIFLISLFILFLFHSLVGRHLSRIARYTEKLDADVTGARLTLERRSAGGEEAEDELDRVVNALNDMHERLLASFSKTRQALADTERSRVALRELNANLEQRVAERTLELSKALDQLLSAQRMAALSGMVASVSRELYGPLGNMVTVASALRDRANDLQMAVQSGRLTRSGLEATVSEMDKACEVVQRSAQRASEVVESFRRVSADQATPRRRMHSLHTTISDTLNAMSLLIQHAGVHVDLNVPESIEMDGYPNHIEQIVHNLATNSIVHGFAGKDEGCIKISAVLNGDWVELEYADDGVGIPREMQRYVFEPKLDDAQGPQSGLGMSIIRDLTVNMLKGEVDLISDAGQGVRFRFRWPRITPV